MSWYIVTGFLLLGGVIGWHACWWWPRDPVHVDIYPDGWRASGCTICRPKVTDHRKPADCGVTLAAEGGRDGD